MKETGLEQRLDTQPRLLIVDFIAHFQRQIVKYGARFEAFDALDTNIGNRKRLDCMRRKNTQTHAYQQQLAVFCHYGYSCVGCVIQLHCSHNNSIFGPTSGPVPGNGLRHRFSSLPQPAPDRRCFGLECAHQTQYIIIKRHAHQQHQQRNTNLLPPDGHGLGKAARRDRFD